MHDTKVMLGLEQKTEFDKQCEAICPKCTMQQRLIGYACCFGLGTLLNIISWGALSDFLRSGEPQKFVTLFILGNLIQLCGGFFLSGPVAYAKKLVGPEMRCASFFYFVAMIGCMACAFQPTIEGENDEGENECSYGNQCTLHKGGVVGLVIMMIIVCYVCMVWFAICSIPFGRRMVCACLEKTCGDKICRPCKGCKSCRQCMEEGGLVEKEEKPTAVSRILGNSKGNSSAPSTKKPASSGNDRGSSGGGEKKSMFGIF